MHPFFRYFAVLASVQIWAAYQSQFTGDWDEAGNYWEPLHYMIYGTGLRTWEWSPAFGKALRSPAPLLPFSAVGHAAKAFGFTKPTVFSCIATVSALFGAASLASLCAAAHRALGKRTALLLLPLLAFNHNVSFYANRLNMDALMANLGTVALSIVLQCRWSDALPRLIVLTTLVRFNFLPVAAGIIAHRLVFPTPKEASTGFWSRAVSLFIKGSIDAVAILGLFLAIDTIWYGRTTLAAWNSFRFNIVENMSHLFGHSPPSMYVDVLLRDNQLVLTLLSPIGFLFANSRLKWLALPFVATFAVLQFNQHKQDRFLFFLYPLMSLYVAHALNRFLPKNASGPLQKEGYITADEAKVALSWGGRRVRKVQYGKGTPGGCLLPPGAILDDDNCAYSYIDDVDESVADEDLDNDRRGNGDSSIDPLDSQGKRRRGSNTIAWYDGPVLRLVRRAAVVLIIGFNTISGVSTIALRGKRYSGLSDFFTSVDDNTVGHNCLSNQPWVSWWLPSGCNKVYVMDTTDPFFHGYNQVSFVRFEDPSQSALIAFDWELDRPLWSEQQQHWDHIVQGQRCRDMAQRTHFNSLFRDHAIDDAFFVGSGGVGPGGVLYGKARVEAVNATKVEYRSNNLSSRIYQAEAMLGGEEGYLGRAFTLKTEGTVVPGFLFDVEPLDRLFGFWTLTAEGRRRVDAEAVVYAAHWARKHDD